MPKKKDPFKSFFSKLINSKHHLIEQHLLVKTDFSINYTNEDEILDDDDIFNEEPITSQYFPALSQRFKLNSYSSETFKNLEKRGDLLENFLEELTKDIVENHRVAFRSNDQRHMFEDNRENSFDFISHALWQIESLEKFKGGTVQWERLYRLKHFYTGKYLAVNEKEEV